VNRGVDSIVNVLLLVYREGLTLLLNRILLLIYREGLTLLLTRIRINAYRGVDSMLIVYRSDCDCQSVHSSDYDEY